VLGVASRIKSELINSKTWGENDLVVIGEWLDGQHWGLGELRDTDKKWNDLYKSIKPFTLDDVLRGLIARHIDYSYGACSCILMNGYSAKWSNSPFSSLLWATLIGKATSPVNIDMDLSTILSLIEKRIKELKHEKEEENGK
jgi:hypothetical protein